MRLPSLIAGETPLIKPIKKQQLTITPFLYLNQGLIEIRKIESSSRLSAGILGVKVRFSDREAARP